MREALRKFCQTVAEKDFDSIEMQLQENPGRLEAKFSDGETLVDIACTHDYPELIRYLVKLGASVDSLSNDGKAPLFYPCLKGYAGVVRCLLELGADPDGLQKIDKKTGFIMSGNPLQVATVYGQLEIVKLLLLENGASPNVRIGKLYLTDLAPPDVKTFLLESRYEFPGVARS